MCSDNGKEQLLAETAFKVWKYAAMLEDLLWESFHDKFDELYEKECLQKENIDDPF